MVSQGQIATDFSMSLLVIAGLLLCHFQCNRASQAVLSVALLMPVTGLLARAYGIPDAYGQLSTLSCLGGLLCASALLAKQVSQTSMSYLLLLDDTGKHLRWIISLLFLCAIVLGGVGVYFKHDYRLTPLIITLALICVVSIMTFTYYRKGVMHEQVLPPEDLAFASELEAAIAHQEFYLVYQPQLDFMTGELVGVEARRRGIDPLATPATRRGAAGQVYWRGRTHRPDCADGCLGVESGLSAGGGLANGCIEQGQSIGQRFAHTAALARLYRLCVASAA